MRLCALYFGFALFLATSMPTTEALSGKDSPSPISSPLRGEGRGKREAQGTERRPSPVPPRQNEPQETFLRQLMRFVGIFDNPTLLKGLGDESPAGDVWVYDVSKGVRDRLTWDGGFRAPVFEPDNKHVLALKGEMLVRVSVAGGEPQELFTVKDVVKLVGFHRDRGDEVLVVTTDKKELAAGVLSLSSGEVARLSHDRSSETDDRLMKYLVGWERVYDEGTVYVEAASPQPAGGIATGTDVFLLRKEDREPIAISNCQNARCGQPSLSRGGLWVVYINAGP